MKKRPLVSQVPIRHNHKIKKRKETAPGSWEERKKEIKHRWATPFIWIEWLLFSKPLFKFLQLIAYGWLIAGIIIYWCEGDKRKKQKHYQAWQVINLAQGKTGSGGRIQALHELNEDGVSLAGVDAAKAYLVEINLHKADLRKAILGGANLVKANLQGANLWGANLRESNLYKANLQGTFLVEANLQGANLQKANLQESNLQRANLQGANLQKANLQVTDLNEAKLLGANLVEANLQESNLVKANLQGASLSGANLQGAFPLVANLQEANLQRANLQGAILWGANLRGASLQGADLVEANLQESNLREAKYITIEQLSTVVTLYKAKLDPELEEQIKEKYPHLLEKPKEVIVNQ